MQFGMIGLGRMGAGMVRRLMRAGHDCVVYDRAPQAVLALVAEGATGSASLAEFVAALALPRHLCLMVPAAYVDASLEALAPLLAAGDTIIDGGNSNFQDDIARAARLGAAGLHYVDMGTSGGVWGLERGYCLMIGGESEIVHRLDPVFRALAPGRGAIPVTPGRGAIPVTPGRGDIPATPGTENAASTAEEGYLHCGPNGAGHFVKMIHNGIEYGLMAAYAEGFNILKSANLGAATHEIDAETTPLAHPEHYRFDFDLPAIAELWRRGSVIPSWLLDLTAQALAGDPALERFSGRVSDSGEGRWTVAAANDLGVPAFVLAAALFERFASRGNATFQNQVQSAMRFGFGGHQEKPAPPAAPEKSS